MTLAPTSSRRRTPFIAALAAFLLAAPFAHVTRADPPALGSPAYQPTSEHPVGWRGDGTGRYPAATPPLTWSRTRDGENYANKNILWAVPLPAVSVSSPIIVGDKVFLTSEFTDLLCIDKATGHLLWIRSNPDFEGLSPEDRQADPEAIAKLAGYLPALAQANASVVEQINAQSNPASAIANKRAVEKQIIAEWCAFNKKKGPYNLYGAQDVFGYAGMTPCSDGKHVYVYYATGIAACYDLNGKRLWIARGKGMAAEHGNFTSPVLAENQFIVWAQETRAYDAATGKLLWKNPGQTPNTYNSLYTFHSGGDLVVCGPNSNFTRIRDGKPIWNHDVYGDAVPTPIVEGRAIFALGGYDTAKGFNAYAIPASTDSGKVSLAYPIKSTWPEDQMVVVKGKTEFNQTYVASPLFVNGLLYRVSEGGGLIVNNASTGDVVYTQVLPGKPHTEYWNWAGSASSPTLAGKYIYLYDNRGTTVVIQPGKEYKEIARNTIEEFRDGKEQVQTLATPVFEGARMFYRTPGFLYCIGEK